ncbi:hypothetical protein FCM30_21690 [Lelliottia aquatilis]|uniref:hypothetical protein n=1 Tax=Lelliottia aquatilis TaxID=2080838 RepID=UPI00157648B1|nr:hypothetical protein [Lelliottia aquatilis]NTZ48354.1 hypothetical protein [Lelliottia aquatilis]
MTSIEIANTILAQLGGNRFIAMTGAKNFLALTPGLQLDLPKKAHFVKNGITRFCVELTPADTYTIKTWKIRGMNAQLVDTQENVYCDELQSVFTELTGLDTHL